MASFTQKIQAGNAYAFGWFIDSFGFPTGATASAPSQGATGSGAFRIRGIKNASITIPTPEGVPVTGDDSLLGEFQFPSVEIRRFDIDFSVDDLDLLATLLNITLQTWGEARVALNDLDVPPEYNMGFILQSKAKKFDTGVQGQKGWGGTIVPLATASPLGRVAFEERGAAVFRYSISPQSAGYDPRGFTINTANYNVVSGGGRQQPFTAEYPLHLKTWRGTGAVTEFNLDFQPITAAKTPFYERRVAKTTSAVNTTTNTGSVSVAAAAGAELVSIYEFNG